MKIADCQQIQKIIIKTLSSGPNTWHTINRAAHGCDVSCNQSQVRTILNGLISAGIVKRKDTLVRKESSRTLGYSGGFVEYYSLIN